jgi:hypothetical protein
MKNTSKGKSAHIERPEIANSLILQYSISKNRSNLSGFAGPSILAASEIVRDAHYMKKPLRMRPPIFPCIRNRQILNNLTMRQLKLSHTRFFASLASPALPAFGPAGAARKRLFGRAADRR